MIKGLDKVESIIGKWNSHDLAIINRIVYDSEKAELLLYGSSQARSKSWPNFGESFDSIKLSFYGVSNLHLKQFGESGCQIMGFAVTAPIVEGGYYEVEDYEDGRIEFICDSVEIDLV